VEQKSHHPRLVHMDNVLRLNQMDTNVEIAPKSIPHIVGHITTIKFLKPVKTGFFILYTRSKWHQRQGI
jgi:hypothetical protein